MPRCVIGSRDGEEDERDRGGGREGWGGGREGWGGGREGWGGGGEGNISEHNWPTI